MLRKLLLEIVLVTVVSFFSFSLNCLKATPRRKPEARIDVLEVDAGAAVEVDLTEEDGLEVDVDVLVGSLEADDGSLEVDVLEVDVVLGALEEEEEDDWEVAFVVVVVVDIPVEEVVDSVLGTELVEGGDGGASVLVEAVMVGIERMVVVSGGGGGASVVVGSSDSKLDSYSAEG